MEGNRIGGIQPYGEKAGATPTYFPINNGSLETLNIGVSFVILFIKCDQSKGRAMD